MFTQRAAVKTVNDFVADCRAAGICFDKVILFGSYAKGEQHEWSDIDVALVADRFIGFLPADNVDYSPIKSQDDRYAYFQIHTFPTDYFTQGDPFIDEIKATGIVIHSADDQPVPA